MSSQTVQVEAKNHTNSETTAPEGGRGRYRSLVGASILALAVLAALVAGGWGVVSSLSAEAPPARLGEDVEVPGGVLRVEKVTPEHMVPMQSSKFSAGGMNMSSTGMDMAPEGYKRFVVVVTLAGRGGELAHSPEDFRLSGPGVKDHAPIRSQLLAGAVPEGSAVSGSLVFQAPEESKGLTLRFDDGRSIALDLPADEGGEEGHAH